MAIGQGGHETRILRVRTRDESGAWQEWEYEPDRFYMVLDSSPVIEFLVDGHGLKPDTPNGKWAVGSMKQEPAPPGSDPTTWRTWDLGEWLAANRIMGAIE